MHFHCSLQLQVWGRSLHGVGQLTGTVGGTNFVVVVASVVVDSVVIGGLVGAVGICVGVTSCVIFEVTRFFLKCY